MVWLEVETKVRIKNVNELRKKIKKIAKFVKKEDFRVLYELHGAEIWQYTDACNVTTTARKDVESTFTYPTPESARETFDAIEHDHEWTYSYFHEHATEWA